MFDVERLKADADALTVAQYIGLSVVNKGQRNYILCPGHAKRIGKPDRNIGNCVLTQYGYHCFACNSTVSVTDMVIEVVGCTYPQALKIMAEACGGVELYSDRQSRKKTQRSSFRLTPSDFELLGLTDAATSYNVVNATYDECEPVEEAEYKIYDNGLYLVCRKGAMPSIKNALETNDSFHSVIADKAKQTMDKYKIAIAAFGSRSAAKANIVYELFNEDGFLSSETMQQLLASLNARYRRAQEIHEYYRKG